MKKKEKPKQVLMVGGDIARSCELDEGMFEKMGFTVKKLDTIDMAQSMRYNPLKYVDTDNEIYEFTDFLIKNTNSNIDKSDVLVLFHGMSTIDDSDMDKELFVSLIALLRDWFPKSDYTFSGLLVLLSMAKALESDEGFISPLDLIFEEIETGRNRSLNPDYKPEEDDHSEAVGNSVEDNCRFVWVDSQMERRDGYLPGKEGGTKPEDDLALRMYKEFRNHPVAERNTAVDSCCARLGAIGIDVTKKLTETDEIAFDSESIENSDAGYAVISRNLKFSDSFTLLHKLLYMQAEKFAAMNGFIFSEVKHGRE